MKNLCTHMYMYMLMSGQIPLAGEGGKGSRLIHLTIMYPGRVPWVKKTDRPLLGSISGLTSEVWCALFRIVTILYVSTIQATPLHRKGDHRKSKVQIIVLI